MDSNSVFPRISLLVFLFICAAYNAVNAVNVFNIRDNNGIPDGKTDNSQVYIFIFMYSNIVVAFDGHYVRMYGAGLVKYVGKSV